ncbi:MAG: glycoside hydrolase family 78 protein [Clostridiales bacterium]|nr:glycoside hydrolase family 78 protein [Clostridiales bacterium]
MESLRECFITSPQPFREGRVDVFRQKITVQEAETATLAITALGVYEANLNGQKVGDRFLAPGYTYYPRDLQVQRYEVALSAGENELVVFLGQGWYCGRYTYENQVQIYGETPAVAWILEGAGVRVTSRQGVEELESPYEYAGLYDGEIYHAEALTPSARRPAPFDGAVPEVLEEQPCGVRLREELPVRKVTVSGDSTILDFGQNFAGVLTIDPGKLEGDCLRLRHGELLNPDGSLYTANLRRAKQELVYYKGGDTRPYTPRFTYMGFRYVELTGAAYVPGLVTAHAVYSDMERTGAFSCENPLVQKLYENQVWGQKSNYIDVPTDCPQRDERMGYPGDGHVFARTGAYNFDTSAFWRKFLKDIRYTQMDNSEGYVPPVVPATGPTGIGFMNMLGWGNAVTLLPEQLYWQYGEENFLTDQYESIRLFVECEMRHLEQADLWLGANLGDWLALGKDVRFMAMHNGPVSNAFVVHDLKMASALAEKLGRHEDTRRWGAQLEKTRAAYLRTFVTEDGHMTDDYQGAYVMALAHVLPDGALRDKVFANLVASVRTEGMQTGFFATQHILPLLAEGGEAKLAFDLLLQEECPGWMYQVIRGATTTWERWDALRPDGTVNESKMSDDNMVSFNHYAFGSVGEFYYRYILGIQPALPGFRKVRIRPFVDRRLGRVEGSYRSRQGLISVAWQVTEGSAAIAITTPAETEVVLPDGSRHTVSAGSYSYQCAII